MFYKEVLGQTELGSIFLGHLEAQFRKCTRLVPSMVAFVDLMYVAQNNSGYVTGLTILYDVLISNFEFFFFFFFDVLIFRFSIFLFI